MLSAEWNVLGSLFTHVLRSPLIAQHCQLSPSALSNVPFSANVQPFTFPFNW